MTLDSSIDVDRGIEAARRSLSTQAAAVAAIVDRIDPAPAISLIAGRSGRVVVSGLGKSGLIGAKLAATFASTGTPSQFVHAADALHGDSGVVVENDTVVALSNSGTTVEVVTFAEMVAQRSIPVIAITCCGGRSPLAAVATVHLDAGFEREADPWNLVPTCSTTVSLVVGDAIAIGLMAARNFGPDQFRLHHPGGALGTRLSVGVQE